MRLVDSLLAEEFGISRTPIRDAIRQLVEEGLVYCGQNKGYFVFKPNAADIREVFELREILDVAAATKLIEKVLPAEPSALEKIRRAYEASRHSGDRDFVQGDENFHDCIIALSGNTRLTSIYADLRNQIRAFRSIASKDQARMNTVYDYHEKIFQGIEKRDLPMTIAAIRRHLQLGLQEALQDIGEDRSEG